MVRLTKRVNTGNLTVIYLASYCAELLQYYNSCQNAQFMKFMFVIKLKSIILQYLPPANETLTVRKQTAKV